MVEIIDGPFKDSFAYYSHPNPMKTYNVFVFIPKEEKNGKLNFNNQELSIDYIKPAPHYESIDIFKPI